LLNADVITTVCRKIFNDQVVASDLASDSVEITEKDLVDEPNRTDDTTETVMPNTTWHAVKRVLKRRKKKGRVQYLVEWDEDSSQSWVDRSNLSDAALQSFLATRKPKRRTRRN
jgi:hypothetical protein